MEGEDVEMSESGQRRRRREIAGHGQKAESAHDQRQDEDVDMSGLDTLYEQGAVSNTGGNALTDRAMQLAAEVEEEDEEVAMERTVTEMLGLGADYRR